MADRHSLDGRVALVTGAGRGLGRAHARLLSELGAAVLVNDADAEPARDVAGEIAAAGGTARADATPVGTFDAAAQIVDRAQNAFGRLDIVVNNAGILRPRSIVSMTAEEWGDVLRTHLDGTFTLTQAAARHWRDRTKVGETPPARLVNTTSASGLFGQGQANYAAAKAGIVALTLIAAGELARYGATVNAVAPVALTRMSEGRVGAAQSAEHAARLVGWLCTDAAAAVTGQVFNVAGGHVSVVERPHTGPGAGTGGGEAWSMDALDEVVPALLRRAPAHPDLLGYRPDEPRPASLADVTITRRDDR